MTPRQLDGFLGALDDTTAKILRTLPNEAGWIWCGASYSSPVGIMLSYLVEAGLVKRKRIAGECGFQVTAPPLAKLRGE